MVSSCINLSARPITSIRSLHVEPLSCPFVLVLMVLRRVGDVPDLTADPALAEKELGFRADRTLDEMCRDLWNFQSKHPNGYLSS